MFSKEETGYNLKHDDTFLPTSSKPVTVDKIIQIKYINNFGYKASKSQRGVQTAPTKT